MNSFTPSSVIVATRDQVSCEVAGETVLLQMKEGAYYGLDEVGTTVWKQVQNPVRIETIEQTILAEFEVSEAQCRADLKELIDDLLKHHLIEVVPEKEIQ